ncbi:MAG: adenylyl-sulfate kinase [Candidatus Rokubacteria bacterium]|nr:adenylyl-sulfate kinase [Candidatus Rokubacteria bacterium]
MRPAFTIWFTGLPSAGKSTLARLVEAEILQRGFPIVVLDGDEVRTWLTAGLGFSREDRDENIRRISTLAAFLNRTGVAAITAAISPYRQARERARGLIGRFVEVYTECPLEICEERDVKGLYGKARRGEVQRFTGVSDPYEPPATPEVIVRTHEESKEACVARILERVEELGYLPRGQVRYEVLLPAYLSGGLGDDPAAFLSELASREATLRGAGVAVTDEERQVIQQRLRALGYLE